LDEYVKIQQEDRVPKAVPQTTTNDRVISSISDMGDGDIKVTYHQAGIPKRPTLEYHKNRLIDFLRNGTCADRRQMSQGAKIPLGSLSAILVDDVQFESLGKGLWRLRENQDEYVAAKESARLEEQKQRLIALLNGGTYHLHIIPERCGLDMNTIKMLLNDEEFVEVEPNCWTLKKAEDAVATQDG